MRNQVYDLPAQVGKTSYRYTYTPDRDVYLQSRGRYIDSHTKFSKPGFS